MNKKFKVLTFLLMAGTLLSLFVITKSSMAQTPHLGQVFMRGHYAHSDVSRGGDLLTGNIPILGTGDGINDRDGYGISTGVDILVTPKDPFFGQQIWGEVGLEYSRFGDEDRGKNLPAAIEDALGLPRKSLSSKSSDESEIAVNIFNVYIGPKWRFSFGEPNGKLLDINRLHPYIGAAMMFGVISPPSDDITYIDIGALVWTGFDYVLPYLGNLFSIGADYRHHFFGNATGNDIDYGSAGVFFTVNF